jgi:ketosteroid isomerase-like protein
MLALVVAAAMASQPDSDAVRAEIAAIDAAYQAAVERNDEATMAKILHKDFTLVLGDGSTYSRADLLRSARDANVIYEAQVEDPGTQAVRLYGPDTATVTARLYLKGRYRDGYKKGQSIERRLWFTDTYVRTPEGWRYAFGQASLPLPDPASPTR